MIVNSDARYRSRERSRTAYGDADRLAMFIGDRDVYIRRKVTALELRCEVLVPAHVRTSVFDCGAQIKVDAHVKSVGVDVKFMTGRNSSMLI